MRNIFTRSLSIGDIVLALIILALIVPYGWIIYSNQSIFRVSNIFNGVESPISPQLTPQSSESTVFPDLNLSLIIPPDFVVKSATAPSSYVIESPSSEVLIELSSYAVPDSFTECSTANPGQINQEIVLISQAASDKSLTIVGSKNAEGLHVLNLQNTWIKARYISDPNTRDGQIRQNLTTVIPGGTYFTCSTLLSPSAIPNAGKESLKGFMEVFSVNIVSKDGELDLNSPSDDVLEAISILKSAKQL